MCQLCPKSLQCRRQLLEAEQARLTHRLEENERAVRGMLGTRRAYRQDLATVTRQLAALPAPNAH